MSARDPTMAEVLTQALRNHTDSLRVAMPGRIESFDPATQTASVAPLQRQVSSLDGQDINLGLPVLSNVPVLFPGGGQFALTFPVQRGDTCWVVFGDLSLDEWWSAGGEVTPTDLERHGLNGAVAFLGCRAKPDALTEFDANRAVFGNHGPRVACDGSTVHLGVAHGESAGQSSIRGDEYLSAENSFIDALDAVLTGGLLAAGTYSVTIDPASLTAWTAAKLAFKNRVAQKTGKVKVP